MSDPKAPTPEPQLSAEEQLKGSFLLFLWYVWTRVLSLPVPTRIQKDIARFLEEGPRKRFIAAFRGVGKTFITGAYIVWRLWKEPNLKILVVSANETFAGKVAGFVHQLINAIDIDTGEPVPWAELAARPGQRDSTLNFDVGLAGPDKDPSVFALGINGQLPGTRADLILSDDVEVPTNSETEAQREKLEGRTGEYAAILKPGGEVVYLGTFQSMQSIYRSLRSKGYAMRLWPARYPLAEKLPLYEGTIAPMLREDIERDPSLMKPVGSTLGGAPTDPQRFDDVDLMEREVEWRKAGFQLQFMLDTSLTDAERYPLKTRDLILMDVAPTMAPRNIIWGSGPQQVVKDIDNVGFDGDRLHRPVYISEDWQPYTGTLLEIDPSGRGRDETAYVVTKFLNGLVFIRQWGGFRDGHSETTLAALADIAVTEKVSLVRVEGNFGDGMFTRLLEPHLRRAGYKGGVEDHKVTGNKEHRMMANIRPALQSHRLVLDTSLARKDTLASRDGGRPLEYGSLYQLTHLTEQRGGLKHDDRVDVLSNALDYWAQYMGLDAKAEEEKAHQREVKAFHEALKASSVLTPRPSPHRGRQRGQGRRVR